MFSLRKFFLYLALVLPLLVFVDKSFAQICGTNIEDVSMSINLKRSTDRCWSLESSKYENYKDHYFNGAGTVNETPSDPNNSLEDNISSSCLGDYQQALLCCLNPVAAGCRGKANVSLESSVMGGSAAQTAAAIEAYLMGQNSSAVKAYNCKMARERCASTCDGQDIGRPAQFCKEMVSAEHCENRNANAYLTGVCDTLKQLSVTKDADSPDVMVLCSALDGPDICNSN